MLKQLTCRSSLLLRRAFGNNRKYSSASVTLLQRYRQNILEETKISREHMTPEIALQLITPECRLFSMPIRHESEKIFPNDPFWAFYWPGGQALSRYLLDNPDIVANRTVLDVGCGCGASSLIALKHGAKHVHANDIDEVAGCAVILNAAINSIRTDNLRISKKNLIGSNVREDIILLGDLFYDEDIAEQLLPWLNVMDSQGKQIYIGDPGRHGLTETRLSFMKKLITYELPESSCIENHGYKYVNVWKFKLQS